MKEIKNEDLKEIKGGFSLLGAIVVSAIVAFVSGVISGISNPEPCNR